MSVEERMRQFVERMYASGVARPGDLRGCSAPEIAALEQRHGLALPQSYSLFLSTMGHATGKLGNLGEFDLSYGDALKLNGETVEAWRASESASNRSYASAFPAQGLVFCARLGNPDYWLIVCRGQDDSPVIHFDYESEPVRFEQTQDSLFGFLEELRQDAEHWIAKGTL
jgi:hypothetical protein